MAKSKATSKSTGGGTDPSAGVAAPAKGRATLHKVKPNLVTTTPGRKQRLTTRAVKQVLDEQKAALEAEAYWAPSTQPTTPLRAKKPSKKSKPQKSSASQQPANSPPVPSVVEIDEPLREIESLVWNFKTAVGAPEQDPEALQLLQRVMQLGQDIRRLRSERVQVVVAGGLMEALPKLYEEYRRGRLSIKSYVARVRELVVGAGISPTRKTVRRLAPSTRTINRVILFRRPGRHGGRSVRKGTGPVETAGYALEAVFGNIGFTIPSSKRSLQDLRTMSLRERSRRAAPGFFASSATLPPGCSAATTGVPRREVRFTPPAEVLQERLGRKRERPDYAAAAAARRLGLKTTP